MLLRVFRFAALLFVALSVPASLVLLAVSESWQGRVFAVAGVAAGLAPLCFSLGLLRPAGGAWKRLAAALGTMWLGLTLLLLAHAPAGRSELTEGTPGAKRRIQHRYYDGDGEFVRWAPGNLLPEADLLRLAFTLAPLVDRILTRQQGRALRQWTSEIYAQVNQDRQFRALGSVLPLVSGAAWSAGSGHGLLYVPPGLDRSRPAPILVFLHGSGGSFQAYSWILSGVANELGMVVAAPSGGLGWWPAEKIERVIEQTLADAAREVPIDPRAVHLLGLSNGGLGVSRAGRLLSPKLASLTFLCPVLDEGATNSDDFLRQWRGRPIQLLSGALDDRIPAAYLATHAALWQAAEIRLRQRVVADGDHFLIFNQRQLVVQQLVEWLRTLPPPD